MPNPDLCAVCVTAKSCREIGAEYTCANPRCIHASRLRQGLIKRKIEGTGKVHTCESGVH